MRAETNQLAAGCGVIRSPRQQTRFIPDLFFDNVGLTAAAPERRSAAWPALTACD